MLIARAPRSTDAFEQRSKRKGPSQSHVHAEKERGPLWRTLPGNIVEETDQRVGRSKAAVQLGRRARPGSHTRRATAEDLRSFAKEAPALRIHWGVGDMSWDGKVIRSALRDNLPFLKIWGAVSRTIGHTRPRPVTWSS